MWGRDDEEDDDDEGELPGCPDDAEKGFMAANCAPEVCAVVTSSNTTRVAGFFVKGGVVEGFLRMMAFPFFPNEE